MTPWPQHDRRSYSEHVSPRALFERAGRFKRAMNVSRVTQECIAVVWLTSHACLLPFRESGECQRVEDCDLREGTARIERTRVKRYISDVLD